MQILLITFPFADTGSYVFKSGTITIKTPDTTAIFDASKDQISIYNIKNNSNYPNSYNIYCMSPKNGYVYFTITGLPTVGVAANISYLSSSIGSVRSTYYYQNSYTVINGSPYSNNAGTFTLSGYNSNGIALASTFTTSLAKYNTKNRLLVNNLNYAVTGTFDLKLNPK